MYTMLLYTFGSIYKAVNGVVKVGELTRLLERDASDPLRGGRKPIETCSPRLGV